MIVKKRLTMKNIWSAINDQFFNLDNKLLKTFTHLFTKPELVIKGFIDGTRKKYLNVIQYFAISLTLVGIQVFLLNTFFQEALNIELPFLEGLENAESQKNNPFKDFGFDQYNNYQSVFYILSVPISAISTWMAYRIAGIKRYNFTEHLVINLYYSAQIIIITAVVSILLLCFGINYYLITALITIFTFIYLFYILKRVFKTTFLETLAYFFMVMIAFGIVFVGILILGVIVGVVIALVTR